VPLQAQDLFEIDGVQTPRLFVSARASTGIDRLRATLAEIVSREGPDGGNDLPLAPQGTT